MSETIEWEEVDALRERAQAGEVLSRSEFASLMYYAQECADGKAIGGVYEGEVAYNALHDALDAALERERVLREERDEATRSADFWKSIVYCDQPPLPIGDDEDGRNAILRRLSFLAHAMVHPQSPQLVRALDEAVGNILCHHAIGLRFNVESGLYESPAFTAALAAVDTPQGQEATDGA